ncbi:MAG TPA: recombinase family protein [Methanomassiliicoccales archaeon]|nr:recombinase family protein [Methanomassiliicoccales archaeon]
MRAAIYARVSTEDQAKEGFSIAAQSKRMNAYCKARGWQVAGEYVDEGYSGREIKRPAYLRMMNEKDLWDVLVVLKMDRIHRNSRNFAVMMDNLRDWGKEFNSMQESFDTTTAIGRFVMDTIQRIAQLESEQIGERVKMGMTQKAKKGNGYLGFGEPYGYDYVDKKLLIKEDEAAVVREIFITYLVGASLQDIIDGLNARKISAKKGGQWTKEVVSSILKNPLYCGWVRWDGILRKGQHLPVITVDQFNSAQVEIRLRQRREPRAENLVHVGMVEVVHG